MSDPGQGNASGLSRRDFLHRSAMVGAGLSLAGAIAVRGADGANNKIVIGVMGTSRNSTGGDGRGCELARGFAALPGAEVAYVCDVDDRNVPKAIESVAAKQAKPPQGVRDFRRILDDRSVDALVIATPDHWHTPAAMLACQAGKHVYVEKPCSHNAREGEMLVAAARKHDRVVQHGTQRRSWPAVAEGIAKARAGQIGRVLLAKSWYFAARPTIGRGKATPVPQWLDYPLWQGPAPQREYRDNILHYNWHWFWHWGTGELGNNGVHFLDLARWGMDVDYPTTVTSAGGKYRYDDDQETPDTNSVAFDFGGKMITWEGRSWAGRSAVDPPFDVAFYGEKGTLVIRGAGYAIYDPAGKELAKGSGNDGDAGHLQNFLDAIRGQAKLNAEIEEGHKSALLCHLGNIAYRTGRAVHLDPTTRRIVDDKEATGYWGREYREGWEPKV